MKKSSERHIGVMAETVGMTVPTLRNWCESGLVMHRKLSEKANAPRVIPITEEDKIRKLLDLQKKLGPKTSIKILMEAYEEETNEKRKFLPSGNEINEEKIGETVQTAIENSTMNNQIHSISGRLDDMEKRLFTEDEKERMLNLQNEVANLQKVVKSVMEENQALNKKLDDLANEKWWNKLLKLFGK